MGASTTEIVRFLRLPDVLDRIGMKKSKLYDMVKKGEFPAPLKIGDTSVWPDSVVHKWQTEKMGEHA